MSDCNTHTGIHHLNHALLPMSISTGVYHPHNLNVILMVIRRYGIALVGTPWWVRNGDAEHNTLNMEPKTKQIKRGHQSSSESDSSVNGSRVTVKNWPEYLIIQSTEEGELTKNPFLTAKTIQGIAGEVTSVKRLRQGDILVHCATRSQAKNLMQLKAFAGCPCTVLPHRSLNSSKGIIRDRERCLQSLSEDDLVHELEDQGVTHVKRFTVRRDSGVIKTNTYLITFSCASLPREIKAGYCNIRVEVFIPNPLRCYKCQRYGHGVSRCTNGHICHRCGSDEHEGFDCQEAPHCHNCKGSHMASSKECPIWIREAEICKIKTTKNISFPEARKLFNASTSTSTSTTTKTYSATVKTVSTRTVLCQTELSWINTEIPMNTPGRCVTEAHAEAFAQTQAQSKPKPSTSKSLTNKPASASIDYVAMSSMASSVAAIQLGRSHPSKPSSSQSSSSSLQSSTSSSSQSSSSPPSQRSKGKTKGAAKARSGRPHKGEDDPIQSFNRYSSLDGMDVDPPTTSGRPASVSPRRERRRTPIKHPT